MIETFEKTGLRAILFLLALLSFISISIGGYLYYSTLKESAYKEAEKQAAFRLEKSKGLISSFLRDKLKAADAISGTKRFKNALAYPGAETLSEANAALDHYCSAFNASVCYLMDAQGETIASSNRNSPDSFVGKNYAFRPYFQEAIHAKPSIYMALGVTSKKRGVYFSHPVYADKKEGPVGIVVIKASSETMEWEFGYDQCGVMLLTDPHGLIFMSSREDWIYKMIWESSPEVIGRIEETRQFGKGPFSWTGLSRKGEHPKSEIKLS